MQLTYSLFTEIFEVVSAQFILQTCSVRAVALSIPVAKL